MPLASTKRLRRVYARSLTSMSRATTRRSLKAVRVGVDETTAIAAQTDSYFLKSKAIVGHFGDRLVTYAVFMRRPVISAPRFAVAFLESMAASRGERVEIELDHPEGAWVGAGEPILHVTGSLLHL